MVAEEAQENVSPLRMRRLLLILFSHRFLAIGRWEFHFLALRLRNAITQQKQRIRAFAARSERPVFLNFGSGPRGVDDPHWINVDGFRDSNVHFLLDLSRATPFSADTFDGVFCEHVFEHFSLEEGGRIAREVHRILAPGGCFRLVVPDAELVLRRYFEVPDELLTRRSEAGETPMEIVNAYFRQRYEHQFLYDWPTIERLLMRSGFKKVSRADFGKTLSRAELVLDDAKYQWESLYVEAVK